MNPFILNLIVEKKCRRCHIVKSISCFYENKKSKDRHSGCCKECDKELSRIRRKNAHPKMTLPEERTCPCCGETKPIKDFLYLKGATGKRGGSKICHNCYYKSSKELARNRAKYNADLLKYQKYYNRHKYQITSLQIKLKELSDCLPSLTGYRRKMTKRKYRCTLNRLNKLSSLITSDLNNINRLKIEKITKTNYK